MDSLTIIRFTCRGIRETGHLQQMIFFFERDITEISGFDNLHHAEGILKEAQEYAAQIYGTKKCFFSVNGSTAALLAAVSASVNKGGKILVARNCHKAVYHALYLRELQPVYIYPHEDQRLGINGGISPERVERYLEENTDVQAFSAYFAYI